MRILIFILLLPLVCQAQVRYEIHCRSDVLNKSYCILRQQVGVKEKTGHNDGKQIAVYLKSVGINYPAAYCAAGQYWCFYEACIYFNYSTDEIPIPRSGMANAAYDYARRYGKRTGYIPQKHDLIVWRNSKGFGHIERVVYTGQVGWVITIGFNTSNGQSGSQYEGNGVFKRKRNIYHWLGSRKIRGLVGFKVNK